MSSSGALPEYMMQPQSRLKVVAGYALQEKLGSGSFAVVYKGVKLQPTGGYDDTSAIKAIARTSEKLTKKVLQNLEVEISILRTYRHRNIVCMHDVQKTANHFYLILEFCAGGDVQGLIRSRKDRRLSEGLTRRLMRDLAHGLAFLWKQQLIHRDIKPQNLLLTGPLPLDELNDPEQTQQAEEQRRHVNFSSANFCLKIADFGFARHLQSTSLAETLCGSPLYMAPEILQHHRYDAKADLWSVGTVLFEMISGEPPFHGENHIDLLRNIQRKAVRLPKDVRVSKECVNLLRLLLSRNPLTRAGFKEFFGACDAFVALGCQGLATVDEGTCKRPSIDLGTIPEYPETAPNSESIMTVVTNMPMSSQHPPTQMSSNQTTQIPQSTQLAHPGMYKPLAPSHPTSSGAPVPNQVMTELATISSFKRMPQAIEMPTRRNETEGITGALHNSTDESSFVMVEHGMTSLHQVPNPVMTTAVVSHYDESQRPYSEHANNNRLEQSPPSSPKLFFNNASVLPGRSEYMLVKAPKGMLSTSPGTGGALMTILSARPQLTSGGPPTISTRTVYVNDLEKFESDVKAATRMLAAAEDVGRRAISVAHLGDRRAYFAMRFLVMNDSSASSVVSITPMEGIVEERGEKDSDEVTDDSRSTEIMASARRRCSSNSIADRSMADVKKEDQELDEMPFAVPSDDIPLPSTGLPSRSSNNFSRDSCIAIPRIGDPPSPTMIQSLFSEALTCYLKALTMLKGAIGAAEGVSREVVALTIHRIDPDQQAFANQMKQRCDVTLNWLGNQFKGVLERGNAANLEIGKFPYPLDCPRPVTTSIEELLFNHSLGYGREGAVKQLLGHNEAARSCYRSAGLLAETLLMESKLDSGDRKTLEGYVDGFSAQITEIDELLLQQNQTRLAASNATSSGQLGSRRSPPFLGLVDNSFSMFQGNK